MTGASALKADFLNAERREQWTAYWKERGVETIFFSALRELQKQQASASSNRPSEKADEVEEDDSTSDLADSDAEEELGHVDDAQSSASSRRLPPHGPLAEHRMSGVADCSRLLDELQARMPPGSSSRRGIVGFVGYPNVGKSSVINALFGAKKVSMSRTPGKTKHLQTLELSDSIITLCDCPGLVFPSVVATKAHLVINGTVPLDELRDFIDPIRLIVGKIGPEPILKRPTTAKKWWKKELRCHLLLLPWSGTVSVPRRFPDRREQESSMVWGWVGPPSVKCFCEIHGGPGRCHPPRRRRDLGRDGASGAFDGIGGHEA